MKYEADLVIMGGGITALAAAYIAAKQKKNVIVLEAASSIGGLLQTFELGGSRLEYFYHHFFTHDAEIQWLCKELGVADKIVYHTGTMGVYRGGKLYDFNGPLDLLKFSPLSLFDKLRFGLTSVYLGKFADWRTMEGTPALDWFYTYAGKQATESIWKPLLEVKFGPYYKNIPIAWIVGRLAQRMNSRKQTEEKLGYMDGSLNVLLEALVKELRKSGVDIRVNEPVIELKIEKNRLRSLKTSKGEYHAKQFLTTIPTVHFAKLLPTDSQYRKALEQIHYFGAVCTILETKKPLSDMYWINVADSGYPFGGIIEHTNLIPKEKYNGRHITYLSRYFAWDDPLAVATSQEIEKIMIQPLQQIFPNFKKSDLVKVHVFKTMTAATVCDLHFSEKVPLCKTPMQNLYMASMPHIYPDERSCNNSIRIAAEACRVMGIDSHFVPANASLSGKIGMNVL